MAGHFHSWIENELATVSALLARLQTALLEDDLHHIRVSFKKLRAVFDTAEGPNLSFKQTFPTLAKFYAVSGELRDMQVIMKKESSLPAAQAFTQPLSLLQVSEMYLKKRLLRLLNSKQFNEGWMAELFLWKETLLSLRTEKLQKQFKPLSKDKIRERNLKNDFHETRKLLKKTIYQSEAFGSFRQVQSKALSKIEMHYLQQLLGEWHDWAITIHWLRQENHKKPFAGYYLLLQQATLQINRFISDIQYVVSH